MTKDAGGTKLYPAWSPDGKRIAYSAPAINARGEESYDLFLVSADGTHKRRLTNGLLAYVPRWSPDSTRLLLTVQQGERVFRPEVIDVDGRRSRPLFPEGRKGNGATWSPDGEHIAVDAFWLEDELLTLERLVDEADTLELVSRLAAMVREPRRAAAGVLEDTLH